MPQLQVIFHDRNARELCWSSTDAEGMGSLRSLIMDEFASADNRGDPKTDYHLVQVHVQDLRTLEGDRYFLLLPNSSREDHYLYEVRSIDAGVELIGKLAKMPYKTISYARVILLWLTCNEMGRKRIKARKLHAAVNFFMECRNGEWRFLDENTWIQLRAAAGL